MDKVLVLIFVAIPEALAVRFAYGVWFRPKDYLKTVQQARSRNAEVTHFSPAVRISDVMNRHPQMDLWWARVASVIVVVIGTLVFTAALLQVLVEVSK